MKRLILIRHAKSSWAFLQHDIDRPLELRGKNDAELVANACIPFLPESFSIYCSVAKRAYDTCLIFTKAVDFPVEKVNFVEKLYTFDSNELENIVKSFSNADNHMILFGHNEAITNFVNKFGSILIDNVPTCGFVSLQFDTHQWQSISNGITLKTIFPRDLK